MKESKVECVFRVDETGQEYEGVAMLLEYNYGNYQFWFGAANILLPNGKMQLSSPGTIKIEDGRTGKFHFNGFKIVKTYGEIGFIGVSPLVQEE
ncbi:hypothetical protein [Gimesia chilikensis]|uniref:hypothetical protein n=1 Tax=Gimesia chilikensis TaxID=2605989 RepID=UPI003A949BBD